MILKKLILSVLILFLTGNNATFAKSFSSAKFNSEEIININVYEKINPAIVSISCELKDGISSGSGCIIHSNGTVLTSSHVIEDAQKIEVKTSDEKIYDAKVLAVMGEKNDLALLKIDSEEKFPVVALGNSTNVKIGQKVLAIGNPFGFSGTLTTGIVSRIDYKRNKIQTDAAINPGSSGGPLVNAKGEVIGISQSIYNPDNNKSNIGIGFAVPINSAKEFLISKKVEFDE